MDLKTFKTDPALDEGAWIKLGDAEIKIARIGSPKYQSAMMARLKPHRESIELGILKEDDAKKIEVEMLADFIVIDWKNMELDGAPLPFSRDNAIKALGIEMFRSWVKEHARNLENYRVADLKQSVEAVAKN